jgi:Zn-dependent protease
MIGLDLPTIISLAITLIIAITVHEFSHAYAADQLGDTTPRLQGRLTLNPRSHLDPLGSILFIITGFGWGKPVMTNPYNFGRRTGGYGASTDGGWLSNLVDSSGNPARIGMAIVAAAGPFSNLVLALIAAIPVRLGLLPLLNIGEIRGVLPSLADFLTLFILVNIGLMLFNLIPISPLDGFKIALGVLPDDWANSIARLEQYGPMILMLLLVSGRFGLDIFGFIMNPARGGLFKLITGF